MFYLPLDIEPNPVQINIRDPLVCMGSCFAENIGAMLTEYKFNVTTNPFGVLYNPHSIFKSLRQALAAGPDPHLIVEHQEVFYHWDTHSTLSATHPDTLRQQLDQAYQSAGEALKSCQWVILSLGTAKVYRLNRTGGIVANCHKVPQSEFISGWLSVEEIVTDFKETFQLLRNRNPDLKVILTVSPVRHVRDGLVANNLSKSILIQAIHNMVDSANGIFYFPSYEIILDVLRDYRFFKEDMIHPNAQAVHYIWQKFIEVYLDQESQEFTNGWEKIKKSLEHRSFHPHTGSHQRFLKSVLEKLQKLSSTVDVRKEIEQIKNQLT